MLPQLQRRRDLTETELIEECAKALAESLAGLGTIEIRDDLLDDEQLPPFDGAME
jgi:hypothetical protein